MDLIEGIYARQSIRAYKPDPVPVDVLTKVMEATLRAPSWGNTQPWEFAIIGGKLMEEIKDAMAAKARAGVPSQQDVERPVFSDELMARYRKNGIMLFQHLGIEREDKQRRDDWMVQGIRFFDAPNGIVIYTERNIGPYALFDLGLAMQTLTFAALGYGLGTCLAIQAVNYPDVLRSRLGIPDSKLIVLGTPIGYPDWDNLANKYRSGREPFEKVVTWHGF